MFQVEKGILRPIRSDDLPVICVYNNDVAVELGSSDPHYSLEQFSKQPTGI